MTELIKCNAQVSAAAVQDRYELSPDVVLVPAPDESVRVVDLGGRIYALPPIGANMLQGSLQNGLEATVSRMAEEYPVSTDKVRADLTNLLGKLETRGLVHRSQDGTHARRSGGGWRRVLMGLLLRTIGRCCRSWEARAAVLLPLARLSFWLLGWLQTVTLWRRCLPAATDLLPLDQREPTARRIDQAVREAAAGNPIRMACKERALCCWSLARFAGMPATLVVGFELYPLGGHCWCEVDTTILSDYPDRCAAYCPVARFE